MNLFSEMAVPLHIPTFDIWGFQFLHILSSTWDCLLIVTILVVWEVGHHCGFELHLSNEWCWASFHVCACWLFVYLLWGNIYSNPLPIFKLGCLSYCWLVRILYLFRILDPYQIYDLQVFSLVLQPSFYFVEVPLKYKVLRFDKFVCLFLGFVSCAFHIISKNHCQVQSHKKFSPILFFYTVLLHSEIL